MKPRIKIHSAWWDCGWRYELWLCEGGGRSVFGPTPMAAFKGWVEWRGGACTVVNSVDEALAFIGATQ